MRALIQICCTKEFACLPQERRSCPKNRSLAVQVSSVLLAVDVVLVIVVLPSAFADVANIAVRLHVRQEREPGFARSGRVGLLVEPSILYASHHGEGKHPG